MQFGNIIDQFRIMSLDNNVFVPFSPHPLCMLQYV